MNNRLELLISPKKKPQELLHRKVTVSESIVFLTF